MSSLAVQPIAYTCVPQGCVLKPRSAHITLLTSITSENILFNTPAHLPAME